jgi:hypothetical protein
MENHNSEKVDNINSRFSKWQMKQIDYLTFNINLILTISLAIIGFIYTSMDEKNVLEHSCNRNSCPNTSIVLFLVIITIGVILNYIRFYAIKFTKDIVKFRKEKLNSKNSDKEKLDKKIDKLISTTKILGNISLIIFSIMTLIFLVSIWTLI